jgi:hypothetical protein
VKTRTQSIDRIIEVKIDFIIFADAALDSRVFAIAHERLAMFQAVLWGFGGTVGIPTIDFYFVPELFWKNSFCPSLRGFSFRPQETFYEQVLIFFYLPVFY